MIKKNQLGSSVMVIFIIIIVIFLAAALIWYFTSYEKVNKNANVNIAPVSNSNANTSAVDASDWQTFTNNNYNYRLKYPKNWYYIPDAMTGPIPPVSAFFSSQPATASTQYASLTILVSDLTDETLATWPEMLSLVADGYAKIDIKVDGQDAVRLERITHPSDNGGWIYVAKGDYMYRITWGAMTQAIFNNTSAVMEAMLDSFEFIPALVSDFTQTGNMSKPAGEENWHLLWETPGNPAITKELIFHEMDVISMCESGASKANCTNAMANGIIDPGDVVTVEGILNPNNQDQVFVISIFEI